ncbi:zinc finger, CCHC-type containing protein [Tanacetum coccineum]
MVVAAQNTNNTTIRSILQQEKLTGPNFTNWYQNLRIVLRSEGKLAHLEQPLIPLPLPIAPQAVRDTYEVLYDAQNEVFQRRLKLPLYSKISPPPKRDNPTKDFVCYHCKEVGHWRRNYPSYLAELKKRKNASGASTLGIFTLELYAFPNKTWVYDMGCGTHICITSQGLKESKKLKHEALSLYVGNGMRATLEAIRSFDLVFPKYPHGTRKLEEYQGLLESSGSDKGLELIQEEDTQPSENTSEIHNEVAPIEVETQNVKVPIRRSARIPHASYRYGFYVDVRK